MSALADSLKSRCVLAEVGDAIVLFGFVRHARQMLCKNPGTAELLGFLQALRDRGYGLNNTLRGTKNWVDVALVTLFKTREDQAVGRVILESFDWSKPKS
jgi:hypothetical protein